MAKTIVAGKTRHRWGPIPGAAAPSSTTNKDQAEEQQPPKKRRRSRWDTANEEPSTATAAAPATGNTATDETNALMLFPGEIVLSNGIKITMPPALTGRHPSGDPHVVQLHKDLAEFDKKIRFGTIELPPEHERSPSPPPIYDSNGVRLNTREVRMKEKLTRQRNATIEELIKRDPTFQPPADYKPEKKSRKLYIPYKEYPDYNFIGLIIGPRGSTHKQLQQDTNTVIAIRGRGSLKEGARGMNLDDDELHVLITGDRQEDVDKAAEMVAKFLVPVEEEMNEHKQKQLRELALINGTLREEPNYCFLCGDSSHRQTECPKKAVDVYRLPDQIQAKVEEQYARDIARMNPGEAVKEDEEYQSFLAELGGTDPREMRRGGVGSGANAAPLGGGGGGGGRPQEPDNVKLWIGNLPPSLDSNGLRALFEPYGVLTRSDVKFDQDTGVSRGFGFIHYQEEAQALKAQAELNGRLVDGKQIVVRRKGEQGPPRGPRPGGGGGGGHSGPVRPEDNLPPECKVYVANIPHHIDDAALQREFERFGAIVSVRQIYDRVTQNPKGYGFICYNDAASATTAITAMDGYTGFDATYRPLTCRPVSDSSQQRQQQQQQQQYQQQHHYGGGAQYGYNYGGGYGADQYGGAVAGQYPPPPPSADFYGGYGAAAAAQGGAGTGYEGYYADPNAYAQYYQQQGYQYDFSGAGGAAAVDGSGVPPPPAAPEMAGDSNAVPPPPAAAPGEYQAPLPPPPPPAAAAAPQNGGGDAAAAAADEYARFMAEMQAQMP